MNTQTTKMLYLVQKLKGRLELHIQFWATIGAPTFIVDTIEERYKIPFRETPKPRVFHNNLSALKDWQFDYESITDLLNSDRIIQVSEHDLIVCNPLSKKKRLILDVRYVDTHVCKQTTKFEDGTRLLSFLTKIPSSLSLTSNWGIIIHTFFRNTNPFWVSAGKWIRAQPFILCFCCVAFQVNFSPLHIDQTDMAISEILAI